MTRGVEQIPWLYDAWMSLVERLGFGRWRAWLARGAAGRTLDLGSGTGRNLPLLPAGTAAVAVEPYPWPIERARRRAPGVPVVLARAEALPFRDGAFDCVLGGLVLCSVEDPPAALAEIRRVLRPGGALRVLEHVRDERPWAAAVQDALQPAWTRFTGGCHPNRDTERAISDAGFRVVERRAQGVMRRVAATRP
ncbi:MAG TPA: class I SAM-dependent methyltransferase [Anaeromyxobacteraceae bacterium]|nr:class I SAM-dependent methyltransferase [Anaeromyxobacteraceae bacterium]